MECDQQEQPTSSTGLSAPKRASGWLQAGVFLAVLFSYLLGGSRTPPYNDSKHIYTVAESIVYRKSIDIPVPGGKMYAQQAFLTSAIHVPGVALRWLITKSHPELDRLVKPMTSHLGNQVMAALGCLVFFRLLVYLGISLVGASLSTLALAFATFLPVYGRTAWSEGLQASCFIGFYSALLRLKDDPGRKTGVWFGIWVGLLINTKYVFVLVLPGAVLFLAYHGWCRGQWRRLFRAAAWSALPGALLLAVILWYNWARTGASTNSGYPTVAGLTQTVFRENLLYGLWSYFFSFGKSIFLYDPPLLISVLAIPLVIRRNRGTLWALLLTASPIVYLYSKFVYWSGDWCWGPRYILFVVPPMLVPAAFLIDEYLRHRRRIALSVCLVVILIGGAVQVAGASQYWDSYIRVSKSMQSRWLGTPNRSGALTPDHGGICDPCFEDFYARNFTPAFQPIEAQWWFLKHHLFSDPWPVAALDQPLRRYTSLEIPEVRRWYEDPPWDWWRLDFVGAHKRTGYILLSVFVTGIVLGLLLWGRGLYLAREPCAETCRCDWRQLWRHPRAFLAPRFGRLLCRLRARGR
jgi:hypothetical protein